jgi:threonine synthase
VVVAPVAVGETFIAIARGFRELAEAGWIARAPRMIAAQAARANAIVRAFRSGGPISPLKIGYTVAEGLAAGDPGRKGAWALRLVREHDGDVGDADDDAILAMQARLARVEGVWAGPTGVAALAVLAQLLAERRIDPAQRFCVVVTETGLKTEAPAPSRDARAFDMESLRRLVKERLAV